MRCSIVLIFIFLQATVNTLTCQVPVSFFATYGNMSVNDCIDDDFSQTVFFVVPESYTDNFFLRVLDPDCGGLYDISDGLWETNTIFEVYGGLGCLSEFDARQVHPQGNYKSGIRLDRALYAKESEVDGKWVSFGPYKVSQGEKIPEYPGYVFFKTIVEGRTGDDTNLYSLRISSSPDENQPIQKTLFFEYEKAFLNGSSIEVTRVDESMLSINQVSLPVTLEPADQIPNLNIIALPIDE